MLRDLPDFPEVPVSGAMLSAELARLAQDCDPRVGLYGPESLFWEVNRHAIPYLLGALQSVQMQLCHPWVASAIARHSKIMSDPRQRARLTYTFLWSLIYGDMDTVTRRANGLYRVHEAVAGELPDGGHYLANEANAMLWVHVTAYWCRVRLYDLLVRRLSVDEKDLFVREAQRYACCFGIPLAMQPDTWAQTEEYIRSVLDAGVLRATREGLEIRYFLERTLPARIRKPLWQFLYGHLPEEIGQMLDGPAGGSPSATKVLKLANRLLPGPVRYVPAWHEAMARIRGRKAPPWYVPRMNRLMLGRSRLV